MRAVRVRVLALLTVVLMLLPGGALARTQYYCRAMGRALTAPCCGAPAYSKSVAPGLESDCCQRLSSADRSASLGTRDALHSAVTALPTTQPKAFPAATPIRTSNSCAEATEAPLALGPPLFVVHCALLS